MNGLTEEQEAARDRVVDAVRTRAVAPRNWDVEELPDGSSAYAYSNSTHICWDVSRNGVCLGKGEVEKMNSEFRQLTHEQQAAVNQAIASARQDSERRTVNPPGGGEAYAYPHADGIAWGFNRASDGFNIARGVTK